MSPQAAIAKWPNSPIKERVAAGLASLTSRICSGSNMQLPLIP